MAVTKSSHVTIMNDETLGIAQELVRGGFLDRTHLGLDYFDASINRVAAWVIGMRSFQKALLRASLEPIERWRELEARFDFTARLALVEEAKSLPWQAVWDRFCQVHDAPVGDVWLARVREYEAVVQAKRDRG